MMKRFSLSIIVFSLWVAGFVEAQEYQWTGVDRIVSVGDIHGAYDNFVQVLQNARLIDDDLDWIGGEAHLVQHGDIVDRGPHSRKAMDLLMELQEEAEDAGGRVHVLIGNHEAMNIVGILDLVSDEEYEAFVDRDSRQRRERFFKRYFEQIRREARERGEDIPKQSEVRREFDEKYPLGFVEHRRAFGPDGKYGEWIRDLNTSIKINGILFSHGDWSEKFSELGIEEVNRRIRQELRGEAPIQDGLTFDPESPLQYRGLAHTELTREAQASARPLVDRILQNISATRMVVGHTVTRGVIESRFDGRHISIDVGMLELYRGGHRVALEIVNDELLAIHDGGSVRIPETMNETNIDAYLAKVAAVDPTNVRVQLEGVDALEEDGRLEEAIPLLETLFEHHPTQVPFRYRDVLGHAYLERGDPVRARAQFDAYIEGLAALVESNPENPNLANLLARYCIDKGLELDLAEEAIGRAIDVAPDNDGFRITMARVQIAQDEYSKAMEVLEAIDDTTDAFDYDRHYLAGLAHLGLDERDRARAAFQRAVDVDPDREEAREALNQLGASPD